MGRSDLRDFHEFVGRSLDQGEGDLTPEMVLDAWRVEHPDLEDAVERAKLETAIAEADRGEFLPLDEAFAQLRKELGFAPASSVE